jgi:hypothetical protein
MIFLVQYDRGCGRIVELRTFEAWEAANEARLDLELRLRRDDITSEVVMLEAADEQALRRTHARYFDSVSELTEAAKAAVSSPDSTHRKASSRRP